MSNIVEENTQNSFERYIGLFTFYIIPINYITFICQILIFGHSWVQNTILITGEVTKGTYGVVRYIHFNKGWESEDPISLHNVLFKPQLQVAINRRRKGVGQLSVGLRRPRMLRKPSLYISTKPHWASLVWPT